MEILKFDNPLTCWWMFSLCLGFGCYKQNSRSVCVQILPWQVHVNLFLYSVPCRAGYLFLFVNIQLLPCYLLKRSTFFNALSQHCLKQWATVPTSALDQAATAMLMPKKNQVAIFKELILKEGVMAAKEDVLYAQTPLAGRPECVQPSCDEGQWSLKRLCLETFLLVPYEWGRAVWMTLPWPTSGEHGHHPVLHQSWDWQALAHRSRGSATCKIQKRGGGQRCLQKECHSPDDD